MPTYLITGANRGIGLELTRQGLARGANVIAGARHPEKATELQALASANPGKLRVVQLDVANDASVNKAAADLGGESIELLINNAGIAYWRGFADSTPEDILEQFNVNAVGPYRLVRAFLPHLRRGVDKKIVNMTSQMGSIDDNHSGGAYGYRMSKAALNMATKSMAHDLRAEGISVAVVHPGWVQTDMGGSGASTTTAESVAGIYNVIDKMSKETSGKFFHFKGNELPW